MSDIAALASAVRDGDVDPLEPARLALRRLREREEGGEALNAFLAAASSDELELMEGASAEGALAGVPVAVKDNLAGGWTVQLQNAPAGGCLAAAALPH